MAASAQETCIINGTIADNSLPDGKKVKKVYLTHTDEFGKTMTVATAKVKKGSYTLKYKLAENAPALQYTLTGFADGQGVALFVEPGEVVVTTPTAIQPEQSTVAGTPTNDTYAEYKAITLAGQAEVERQIAALEQQHGKEWLESAEGKAEVKRIKAKEAIKTEAEDRRAHV